MPTLDQVIDAPSVPEPPSVSLLTTARPVRNPPDHWQAGLRWKPARCDVVDEPFWWECHEGAGQAAATFYPNGKALTAPDAFNEYRPWTAWTGDRCRAGSPDQAAEVRRVATETLDACLSKILERELWSGVVAVGAGFPNDYLTKAAGLTATAGGPHGHVTALAELEQAIADGQCGPGMIHAQPRLVTLWSRNGLVYATPSGRQLRTAQGNLVVPGQGYDGSGTGLALGTIDESWAYATPMVHTILGDTFVVPDADRLDHAVERSQNTVEWRAEKDVALLFDTCFRHGIRVDHDVELS